MNDNGEFKYFLSDHLGSVSLVLDANGGILEQQRYLPGTGLMDYKARFYSPLLGRFTQPDTIIPGVANPQSWNRYSYVGNNPIRYNDPTGHIMVDGATGGCNARTCSYVPPVVDDGGGGGGGVGCGCPGLCTPPPTGDPNDSCVENDICFDLELRSDCTSQACQDVRNKYWVNCYRV
jgi:RHS repeat-associated protein